MTPDQTLNRAKDYIWRQNPPAQMDSEGLQLLHELMAAILFLQGKLPPDTDAPVDKPIVKKEADKVVHLVKGQARMEF